MPVPAIDAAAGVWHGDGTRSDRLSGADGEVPWQARGLTVSRKADSNTAIPQKPRASAAPIYAEVQPYRLPDRVGSAGFPFSFGPTARFVP